MFRPIRADFPIFASDTNSTQQTVSWLKKWLQFKVKCGQKGCVVFDIDDTLVDIGNQRIEAVVGLYKSCLGMGLVCNLVTARRDTPSNRKQTLIMLRSHGITHWDMLFLMPRTDIIDVVTVSEYKRRARDIIEERWKIMANIGDNWHDLIRFPLLGALQEVESILEKEDETRCGYVFFPPMSHDEVSVKLKNVR